MDLNQALEQHPLLKKLLRRYAPEDFLFQQEQMGNTIFLILSGKVALYSKRAGKECLIQYVEAGEFLGEKAMIQSEPFKRFSTAQAVSEVLALELGINEVNQIEKETPALFSKLIRKAFRVAAARLDNLNQLVGVLRHSDPEKRFLHFLKHQCDTVGKASLKGKQIEIDPAHIYYYLEINAPTLEAWLGKLKRVKLIIPEKGNLYTIPDSNALLAAELHEAKAA